MVSAMETTQRSMATMDVPRPNRVLDRLLADRHPLPLSIALHLVPGALIVAVYLLVTEPLVVTTLGLPPLLGWAVAMCLALAPVQLGLLLWLGHRRNGRFSLRGVVHYLDKPIPRGKLVAIVAALIVYFAVVSLALSPLDGVIYESFFQWLPFEGLGGGLTAPLDGYPRSLMIIALAVCVPVTGLALPIIEELYFRGFLLPRLSRLGGWAPLVNSALFSVYHLWTPWIALSRVLYLLPGIWLVQRKKDLRLTIGMHAGTGVLFSTLGVIALLLNLVP